MDIKLIIGRNVRRFRHSANLSQEELAGLADMSQQYISGLESGQRNPTIMTLFHISKILGVEVAELFDAK